MPTFERIIPVLTYRDIPAAHDFLCEAFGFASGASIELPKAARSMAKSEPGMQLFGSTA